MRIRILEASYKSGMTTHLGGGLSMVEIMAVLYGEILNYDFRNPHWARRDRVILSKGHGVLGLFSALVECGILSDQKFETFMQDGSDLIAHPIANIDIGIESSNGSLGQGLSYGIGIAWAAKYRKQTFQTYVYLGDGECDEGSVWEAAMAAPHLKLDNLTVVVDSNGLQSDGSVIDVMNSSELSNKWKSFGWNTILVDGHDVDALVQAFRAKNVNNLPKVLIARTVKGKGVSFMENNNSWHHNRLTQDNFDRAMQEVSHK